jgi:hypothetical protein
MDYSSTPKMEVVNFYWTAQHQIPEDNTFSVVINFQFLLTSPYGWKYMKENRHCKFFPMC